MTPDREDQRGGAGRDLAALTRDAVADFRKVEEDLAIIERRLAEIDSILAGGSEAAVADISRLEAAIADAAERGADAASAPRGGRP